MTCVEELADFVMRESFDRLSEIAREQIKIRVLDSLGCAIGALEGEPTRIIRRLTEEWYGDGNCTLIGGDEQRRIAQPFTMGP